MAFKDLEYNIMIGSALKLSMNSNDSFANSSTFYFPPGYWCNVFDPPAKCINSTEPFGMNLTL